ncbi:MAG TPA: GDP-mannose 4,6-dehydratase [Candidatus Paceibacterota bacterium]|nr:GDP-mannose 4,6-dehydratase [Verrucomicrobiota bacterium]HSA10049.1 GDP-mannose 4,6-dehydratase [Candidatus Paceibacterota bacterium]
MNISRVLVTGGAGFLGASLVPLLLQRGYEVVVIDDFSNGKESHLAAVKDHPKLKIIRGDITIRADVERACAGCDAIIHLAVLCLRQSICDAVRVTGVIVNGTMNCLQVALELKLKLFLNCSSSEVLGNAKHIPMDETHPLHPETPYAAAKVAQDMLVTSYGRTYQLPWATIRPFNMYGPNSHWQGHRGELIPKMIVRALNKCPLIVFGDGQQSRDFLYVEEAALAVCKVLECESALGQTVNFCTGIDTTVQRIAEIICANCGFDPQQMIEYQEARPGDVRRLIGDVTRFKELFGFVPKVSVEDGIARTIEWFKSLPIAPETMLAQMATRNWE